MILRGLVALILRIFFRRVAVVGAEHVPRTGPVLLVLNHPNSLVDPLFLLGLAPRRVVFLAKEPLFRMRVLGPLVRAAGSIPVYRRMDGADTSQNRRTFEKVAAELGRGGAIALFPEGTSHSDPKMRPFKTGTARMALGAASIDPAARISIVPSGLYYTAKGRFRSSALLCFGEPLVIAHEAVDADGEPAPERVRALTAQLEEALAKVTLQAEQEEALHLVTRAERIFSSAAGVATRDRDLAQQFELRQRLLRGYTELRAKIPDRIAKVEQMLARYDAELLSAGLAPENLLQSRLTVGKVVANALQAILTLIFLAPPATIGILVNIVPYQFIVPLVTRAARVERDVLATAKILAAAVAFPLVWTIVAVAVYARAGLMPALVAWLAMPACGYCALVFIEQLDRLIGAARGLGLRLLRPRAFKNLELQRQQIREAIVEMAEMLE